jgi:hypothetical protein
LRSGLTKRHTDDFAAASGIKHTQGSRCDRLRAELFFKPEGDQSSRRIGGELDAGAGLFQMFSLLKYDDPKAVACQRQSRGQPADTGASDNDRVGSRQVLLRASLR